MISYFLKTQKKFELGFVVSRNKNYYKKQRGVESFLVKEVKDNRNSAKLMKFSSLYCPRFLNYRAISIIH